MKTGGTRGTSAYTAFIVADEDLCQRRGQHARKDREYKAGRAHEARAHPQHVLELRVVLCAVVEADDGRAADRIADIDGNKDKLDIHQDAIGRNAVFSEVSEQLEIIDHDDRRQDELQKFSVGKMVGKLDP